MNRRDREDPLGRLFAWATSSFLSREYKKGSNGAFFKFFLNEFHQSERWTLAEIERFQLNTLRKLVSHATHYVPEYTRRFAEVGAHAGRLRTLEDLSLFPVLERAALLASPEKFRATNMHDRELTKTVEGYFSQTDYENDLRNAFQSVAAKQKFYVAPEKAGFAVACEKNERYHFYPTAGILELLSTDGQPLRRQGDEGEIVLTGLTNWATPFIRLRTGDRGILGPQACTDCGRYFSTVEKLRIKNSVEQISSQNAA